MSNNIAASLQLRLTAGISAIELHGQLNLAQVGSAFDRRPKEVMSTADGWTQYTVPTEIGTLFKLAIINPSTNTNAVDVATVDGSANKIVTNTIPAGDFILLCKPDKTKIYLRHAGGTGTVQEVDVFAIEL